jgi:polyhydroxyalkanoate synthesis repressor PhaR
MRTYIALHREGGLAKPGRVVIKKYGNRRLYNTFTSRYINLEELAELVRNGNDVQVVDAKSGEDLTRVTLTQVIMEDAKDRREGLPLELLRELIIASNHVAREGFMWFKPALQAFEGALQSSLRNAGASGFSPLQLMKNLVSAPGTELSSAAELQEMKKRLAELEARQKNGPRRTKAVRKNVKKRTGPVMSRKTNPR